VILVIAIPRTLTKDLPLPDFEHRIQNNMRQSGQWPLRSFDNDN
jgi:hypothetical protein